MNHERKELGVLSDVFKNSTGHIIVKASGSELACVLYLASMHKRPVHITGVVKRDDIEIIAQSKKTGADVTCDVYVWNLVLAISQFVGSESILGTSDDIEALWENIDTIDCFASGDVASRLAEC